MAVNQELLNIVEAIKEDVPTEQIYLFGSHAYGTPGKDSDYDLYLVVPENSPRLLDVVVAARHAMRKVNRVTPVDIVANYAGAFAARAKGPTLERAVANEGVLLYER